MKNRLYFHGVKSFLELFEKNINWNRVSSLPPLRRTSDSEKRF
ncbi:MAG: hypothetical protein QXI18_00030 [Nitrososphaerota archaeon]